MSLCTVLWWLALLSTLCICNAGDEQRWYQHFPESFNNIRPRLFGLPFPGHVPENRQEVAGRSAAGPSSAISRPAPGSVPHSSGQPITPPTSETYRPFGPSKDPFIQSVINGREVEQVKQFYGEDYRAYGLYTVGIENFEVKPYPINLELLQSTYQWGPINPIDFESVNPSGRTIMNGVTFRPDPLVLQRIQNQINAPLRETGWQPAAVMPGIRGSAKEGEFLWPPVSRISRDGLENLLQMSVSTRKRFNKGVSEAMNLHGPTKPGVWTMVLPAIGGQQERRIMMTPVNSEYFTEPAHTSPQSVMWLFHEVLLARKRHLGPMKPRLTLLGASFLPNNAVYVLSQKRVIRPAFAHVSNLVH